MSWSGSKRTHDRVYGARTARHRARHDAAVRRRRADRGPLHRGVRVPGSWRSYLEPLLTFPLKRFGDEAEDSLRIALVQALTCPADRARRHGSSLIELVEITGVSTSSTAGSASPSIELVEITGVSTSSTAGPPRDRASRPETPRHATRRFEQMFESVAPARYRLLRDAERLATLPRQALGVSPRRPEPARTRISPVHAR